MNTQRNIIPPFSNNISNPELLNPTIWGPHFWFFLHTICLNYPKNPNAITKKKYYQLIQNFSLFIPVEEMASNFEKILNIYPIQPYLNNRESIVKWSWFIHNEINRHLEKPIITMEQFYINYSKQFITQPVHNQIYKKYVQRGIYSATIISLIYLCYYLTKR